MRVAASIELSVKERITLEKLRRGRKSPVRAKERAAMILLAADGLENKKIAVRLGQDPGRLDAGGSDMCRWGWRAFSRIRLGRVGLLLLPLRCARGLSNSRLRPSRQERRTGAANRWPGRWE